MLRAASPTKCNTSLVYADKHLKERYRKDDAGLGLLLARLTFVLTMTPLKQHGKCHVDALLTIARKRLRIAFN